MMNAAQAEAICKIKRVSARAIREAKDSTPIDFAADDFIAEQARYDRELAIKLCNLASVSPDDDPVAIWQQAYDNADQTDEHYMLTLTVAYLDINPS